MIKDKEKYLFIVPAANINGATTVLINFLEFLAANNQLMRIEILVQNGRSYDPDVFFKANLEKYGPVTFIAELDEIEKNKLKARILSEKIDVIFYNSILRIDSELFFKEKKCRRIFYIQEMGRVLNSCNLKKHVEYFDSKDNLFFVNSENIKKELQQIIPIPDDRVSIVHSFINPEEIKGKTKCGFHLENFHPQYKSKKQFTIGFSGTFELSKSVDLLLPLVVAIKKKMKDALIFWIGATPFPYEAGSFDLVMHDVKTGGFENDIQFIPRVNDYIKYYQRFDVFVNLSREDAFPIVNIEMGLLGIPVICFDNSGGSKEYVKMGGGISVPYMDLGAIADKVYELYKNPKLLVEYKRTTPAIVENNFSANVQAPKILDKIKNVVKEKI
jgi:glycosyltransferase involved in cell wall biosynthesis